MTNSKVLIVDDDPTVVTLVHRLLQKSGIDADTTTSAQNAIQSMEKNAYAVVLLDIHMPNMDGVETISLLKQRSPLVQIIMLTGDVSVTKVIECVDRGAVDFFSKTNNLDALPDAVHAALAKSGRWMNFLAERTKKADIPNTVSAQSSSRSLAQ